MTLKTIRRVIVTNVVLWSMPLVTFAQGIIPNNPAPGELPGGRGYDIANFIEDLISNLLLPIAGLVAVFFIIIGGFRYITSAGNDEAAEAGKKTLTNAVIGLVIVIFSYVIVSVVASSLRS